MGAAIQVDRAAVDAVIADHCRRLIAEGTYPSVDQLKLCRGVPRNGDTILESRRRLIAAGVLDLVVDDRRRYRRPGSAAAGKPRLIKARPDPEGFVKPLIRALDPPAVKPERTLSPCWREIKASRAARTDLLDWLTHRPEATCPIR